MKTNKIFMIAVVGAALVSCGSKQGGKPNFADNEFAVRTVETQGTELQTSYPATIKGIQDVQIRPKASGFITKVCVQEGQTVGVGQLLFVIDNEAYQAQVRQATAAVNTTKAQLSTAKLTYDNAKKLFDSNVIGQYELETANNTYQTALASVAQAEASLASAKEALSYCYVKSPAAGVVGSLPYKVGALVSASSVEPLTTVSDINTMEVYFSVTEKDMLTMTKNAKGLSGAIAEYPAVKLQLADGSIYDQPGKVVKASGVIDPATGSVSLIARFSNPKHQLRSGGAGQVIIPVAASGVVIIPQEATSEVQNKKFVYIVGKDNKVRYSEIKVNPMDDGKTYIVTEGLKPGDRYVSKGITSLSDGMEIKPISEEQYLKKIEDAAKLGEKQSSASEFADVMSGKKK
ncbi:MAG: efflux RND transporter periplasmic adaptor subunit [Prevotella sp.]|nr:efflux RND transporter periplasmic adaptor subunit [Prevotella sp.]MDD7096732.1 efflux RND transporter periplasmic adaptor subunit [Prevotellaceae bacterium]MDY5005943.1 efflux RND transporter periplasmic adaptor subunit [Prevotella sp.]MDY5250755.1 efflux RND transporter periplasmic adaptor subunit [Prevotella sp.]